MRKWLKKLKDTQQQNNSNLFDWDHHNKLRREWEETLRDGSIDYKEKEWNKNN